MTSRERVRAALEFRTPDRAPRDLWALTWVHLFAKDKQEQVRREYPVDMQGVGALGPSDRSRDYTGRKGRYVDEWGAVWEVGEDGMAGEVKVPPLADWSALATFQPPWEMLTRADWNAVARAQEENLKGPNKFLMGSCSLRPFERLQFLRGTENLFLDMAWDTAEFHRLREMVHDFFLQELQGWVRTPVDAVFFMDDWGSQQALLIAPEMWRALFKPLYRDYCDLARRAGKKVFFHSDGHIAAIFPDLVEIGIDAVNSQLFCMDIEDLARRFKGRITFWGEIDRQHVLRGPAEGVRRAVGRVRRALDDGRGGVFAQCEWGPLSPAENIRAVFDAWLAPIESLP